MEMIGFIYRWGLILQAVAIVHFVQRRPDTFWLWIILMGGGLGALVYIVAEMLPDANLLRGAFDGISRGRRVRELEAIVLDNPAAGNLEELADLYLEDKRFAKARELYDNVILARADSLDPFYRRALAALEMGDFGAALSDLEKVVSKDPKYQFFHRAAGLLALAHARAGNPERAEELFKSTLEISTLSETYFNYASFLASRQRPAEALEWTQRILSKKPTMPQYFEGGSGRGFERRQRCASS